MSEEYIDQIISNALATAQQQTTEASGSAADLIKKNAGFWIEPPASDSRFSVSAVEPEIPTADDTKYNYEAQLDKIINMLSDELADFFNTYYPLESDAFDEAQSWLVNTITNGGTGINASVEAQLWQRDRERITTDARRVKNQIVTGYAAKGYSLAAGSMTKKLERADYEGAGNIGIASTAQAAKQFETEIETIKFAIGKAIDTRTMAMNAAADYIRAVASAPGSATRVAELNTDVKARMMNAASQWYGTRLERDRIVLNSKLAEMQSRDNIYTHRRDNATKNDQVEVQALSAAADVYARAASAALSSLNSVVSSAVNAFE